MDRIMRLLSIIESYSIDRVFIHNLVYVLEKVNGVKIGYSDCKWRVISTGMYCEELEEDLRRLVELGFIKLYNGRIIVLNGARNRSTELINVEKLLREAIMHYAIVESTRK